MQQLDHMPGCRLQKDLLLFELLCTAHVVGQKGSREGWGQLCQLWSNLGAGWAEDWNRGTWHQCEKSKSCAQRDSVGPTQLPKASKTRGHMSRSEHH